MAGACRLSVRGEESRWGESTSPYLPRHAGSMRMEAAAGCEPSCTSLCRQATIDAFVVRIEVNLCAQFLPVLSPCSAFAGMMK
jgi:hypothetical protein